ncbi:hypothetical protein LOAG_11542 [Loa loa]|uniref:Uncharacterized protein n=1 Tax=Loa loa TaxID=7209 RepID=A0A1S0TND5_LOALO|nr:hypothetical protein LOAG_11542 [Loa loa]EFO16961.1 hypothetical protein LOAG_11542 [Loa loa]
MGKKGKRTNRKGKQRKQHAKHYRAALDYLFENETSSDEEISACSARAINCFACLNPKQSSSTFIFSC